VKEIDLPVTPDSPSGGKAYFRESGVDRIPGRSTKIIKAAAMAALTSLAEFPEFFQDPLPGEATDARDARLAERFAGRSLTTEQAMVLDNVREAAAAAMIDSWTLNKPLPTLATIGNLDGDLYEALLDAIGGISAAALSEDFSIRPGVTNETPTDDCGSSDGPLKADPQSSPTPTSLSDSGPSSGEVASLEP
jgi:hypothetical protein